MQERLPQNNHLGARLRRTGFPGFAPSRASASRPFGCNPSLASLGCPLRAPLAIVRAARERKSNVRLFRKIRWQKTATEFSAPGSGGASSRHPRVLAARLKQAVAPACGGRYAPASRAPSPGPFGLRPRLRPLSVTPSCNAVKPRQNPGDSSFPRKPRRPPGGRLRGKSKVK